MHFLSHQNVAALSSLQRPVRRYLGGPWRVLVFVWVRGYLGGPWRVLVFFLGPWIPGWAMMCCGMIGVYGYLLLFANVC
jgi:hypothetical protein